MKSGYSIIWSVEANQNLSDIISYLESHWSEKEIRNFFIKLEKALMLIAERPFIFQASDKRKKLRRCVLTKQTSIYYKPENNCIYIVSLFDNRQNPDKIVK